MSFANFKLCKKNFQGFTLIELLVVVAVIGLVASILLASLQTARSKGRDAFRIQTFEQVSVALELYYSDHGKYPCVVESSGSCIIAGTGFWGFSYARTNSDGTCGSSFLVGELKFGNGASDGLSKPLKDNGYINLYNYQDPLNPAMGSSYNCRYVIPTSEFNQNNIQHYLLHCNLESSSYVEANDGGTNATLFEIIGGGPWICVQGNYP